MSEWVGFSDADLEKMKAGIGSKSDPQNRAKIVKPLTGGRQKGSGAGQKIQRKSNPRTGAKQMAKTQGEVPNAALLSRPEPKASDNKKTTVASPPTTPNDQIPLHGKTFPSVSETNQEDSPEKVSENHSGREPELVEDEEVIHQKEKIKLEDIQRRQKEMEEKNKRKKTMLTKAIAERKKKAFAESHKLIKIQAELSKLDEMLNYDVSILRDKIDEACWEYNHAKKRFDKAEAEYIEAKMHLHKATETKEDLTEHLYHLIQLNEERKAKKLEDLMHKLELEEDDTVEIPDQTGSNQKQAEDSLKPEPSNQENNDPKMTKDEQNVPDGKGSKGEGVEGGGTKLDKTEEDQSSEVKS